MYKIITINCKLEQLKSVVADSMYLLSSFTSAHQAPKKLYKVKWCITVVKGYSRSSIWYQLNRKLIC